MVLLQKTKLLNIFVERYLEEYQQQYLEEAARMMELLVGVLSCSTKLEVLGVRLVMGREVVERIPIRYLS